MPVIMKDNVQYAYTTKGTVFHTLSNAEYEALPESEKMNGDVYCIPDREPILNPDQVWAKIGTGTLDIGDDLTDGVNQLNSSLTPEEFTVTAGENITIAMQKCYKIGKLAVLKITAKATQNITGSNKIIINFPSGMRALQDGAVFISGQGSQWGISNFVYTYLTTNGIIAGNLTANTFIHIDTTFVIA